MALFEYIATNQKGETVKGTLDLADRIASGEAVDDKKLAAMVLKRADTAADIAMFGRMFADNPDFNREAAARLHVSETTFKTHLSKVYEKLGVNDRAAAVRVAYERGLI